ncbi:hypothetical protein O181_082025 [Austropuccinia psidii MF-1]|uniref:Uncharacterized protein n=1 Tax=Austropuccinia psidii MF-1 TaxID=1389203 RepID=A0A9Q3FK70_9BASI|nr:hypothetical protein [Austropuccinia psidii MF-1]
MPTLTHKLASAPPPNHLCQMPKYAFTATTAPPQSSILTLPHPHLILSTAYHAYAPTAPSRYSSNSATHVCPHPSLCFRTPAA